MALWAAEVTRRKASKKGGRGTANLSPPLARDQADGLPAVSGLRFSGCCCAHGVYGGLIRGTRGGSAGLGCGQPVLLPLALQCAGPVPVVSSGAANPDGGGGGRTLLRAGSSHPAEGIARYRHFLAHVHHFSSGHGGRAAHRVGCCRITFTDLRCYPCFRCCPCRSLETPTCLQQRGLVPTDLLHHVEKGRGGKGGGKGGGDNSPHARRGSDRGWGNCNAMMEHVCSVAKSQAGGLGSFATAVARRAH